MNTTSNPLVLTIALDFQLEKKFKVIFSAKLAEIYYKLQKLCPVFNFTVTSSCSDRVRMRQRIPPHMSTCKWGQSIQRAGLRPRRRTGYSQTQSPC